MNDLKMEHLVFDIKRFAVHDGPGIRTTVFLKGCSLHCPWCQNPEGLNTSLNLLYNAAVCIGCHRCVQACPEKAIVQNSDPDEPPIAINREQCNLNGSCIKVCPTGALQLDSKPMTPEMILDEVLKDRLFYAKDHGGVTFSGGDPLFHPEFLMKCIELCRSEGLHVTVETNLMSDWATIEQLIDKVDLFIADIKIGDEKLHDEIVGGNGKIIKNNIRRLNEKQLNILLRTPLIPGYTDTPANLKIIGAFYRELAEKNEHLEFELLNYNPYARVKYEKLGLQFEPHLEKPKYSDAEMNAFYEIVRNP